MILLGLEESLKFYKEGYAWETKLAKMCLMHKGRRTDLQSGRRLWNIPEVTGPQPLPQSAG